jgi:protein-tyrosine phosphatase
VRGGPKVLTWLYTIAWDGPGTLSTMAKPDGGSGLAGEMAALRGAGVLVSALTEPEQDEALLRDEALEACTAGMRFVSLPITDFGIPSPDDVLPVLSELAADLRTGVHVAVHCWAGIGRSSLLAATLLVLNGTAPDDAWALIAGARGRAVPETTAQREWVSGIV